MLLSQYQHTPRGRTKWKSSPAQVQLSHRGQRPSPPILGKTACNFQMAGHVTYPEIPGAGPPGTAAISKSRELPYTNASQSLFHQRAQASLEPSSSPALPHPATQRTPPLPFPHSLPYLKSPSDVQMPRLQPRSNQAWRKATENGKDSDPEETSNSLYNYLELLSDSPLVSPQEATVTSFLLGSHGEDT